MDRQDTGAEVKTSALDEWSGLAARILIGLVLVVSGTLKAAAPPEEFAVVISSYQLVPFPSLVMLLAVVLPWLEVFIGFSLVFGFLTRWACVGAGGMFLMFIGALLSVKLRHFELPNCGCFGWGFHPTQKQALIFDACLVAATLQAWRRGARKFSLDVWCLKA